jgi:hypothetical protein
MYSISGKAGNAIWDAIDRTRAKSLNSSPQDLSGNMHEEGFTMDNKGQISVEHPGPGMTANSDVLSVPHPIYSNTVLAVHTHAGKQPDPNTLGGHLFDQEPSKPAKGRDSDLGRAARNPNVTHAVAGSGDEQVRFYTGSGTNAKIPLKAFPRCQNGKNCYP